MASTTLHIPAISLGSRETSSLPAQGRTAIARLLRLIGGARPSAIDREVADLIERNGGKFTDSLERSIERRLFNRH
jgi:hypothetical protein